MNRLLAHPLPPLSLQQVNSLFLGLSVCVAGVELTNERGERGVKKSYDREKAWPPYKSFNTLWKEQSKNSSEEYY